MLDWFGAKRRWTTEIRACSSIFLDSGAWAGEGVHLSDYSPLMPNSLHLILAKKNPSISATRTCPNLIEYSSKVIFQWAVLTTKIESAVAKLAQKRRDLVTDELNNNLFRVPPSSLLSIV